MVILVSMNIYFNVKLIAVMTENITHHADKTCGDIENPEHISGWVELLVIGFHSCLFSTSTGGLQLSAGGSIHMKGCEAQVRPCQPTFPAMF